MLGKTILIYLVVKYSNKFYSKTWVRTSDSRTEEVVSIILSIVRNYTPRGAILQDY